MQEMDVLQRKTWHDMNPEILHGAKDVEVID
jgi:hypothetical protein